MEVGGVMLCRASQRSFMVADELCVSTVVSYRDLHMIKSHTTPHTHI